LVTHTRVADPAQLQSLAERGARSTRPVAAVPFEAGWPISTGLNKPENDDPSVVAPITVGDFSDLTGSEDYTQITASGSSPSGIGHYANAGANNQQSPPNVANSCLQMRNIAASSLKSGTLRLSA
jgi:hypothetical protein